MMEFFNTGLVFLIISFSKLQSLFPQEEEEEPRQSYNGFESDWYSDVGKILVMTLGLNAFAANVWQFKSYLLIIKERFTDRGYNVHLKKYPDEPMDDSPNTKKSE
jgi:hypothetical protein